MKPADYKLALPRDFKVPKGVRFSIVDGDPRLHAARKLASRWKLGQAAFSRLLAIQAEHEIAEMKLIAKVRRQEVIKLGRNGAKRLDRLERSLNQKIGKQASALLIQRLVLAADVRALERLIKSVRSAK